MAVLYKDANPLDIDPRIEKWYQRLKRYHPLVPFFPKDPDHQERWWYKLGFTAVMVSSLWFFGLAIYFGYLAWINKFDVYYLVITGIWIVIGILLPAGIYRLTIYYLMLKKTIY
jgi:hypothetical protein